MLEFAGAAEIDPFDDVEVTAGIDGERMRRGEKRGVGFAVGFAFAIAKVGHEFIRSVDDGYAAGQVGDVDFVLVLVEAAGVADLAIEERALVIELEGEDFDAAVLAVGDIHFRRLVFAQGVDPDAMTGVELAVFLAMAADGFDLGEVLVKPRDALAAVTVHHIDVAIGRDGDISRVFPDELLRSAAVERDVADGVKDFAVQIGLVNAGAESGVFRAADVLGPVDVFFAVFLAKIKAMRGGDDLFGCVTDAIREVLAPGLEDFAFAVENGNARIRRARGEIDAILGIDNHAAAETVFHALGQFAPILNGFVGVITAADADGRFFFVGSAERGQSGKGGGSEAGGFHEVAAGEPLGKEIFFCVHKNWAVSGGAYSGDARCREGNWRMKLRARPSASGETYFRQFLKIWRCICIVGWTKESGTLPSMKFLKSHPFPVIAYFDRVVAVSYAFPEAVLRPLVPDALEIDTFEGLGFLTVAMVWTRHLRPAGFPAFLGQDFFLSGFRVFTRFTDDKGRRLRGLKIVRSETDKRRMVWLGNQLTRYHYRHVKVQIQESDAEMRVQTFLGNGSSSVDITLDKSNAAAELPAGSPFGDWRTARQFAGPMPFTFSAEADGSVVVIEGRRQDWVPRPIGVKKWQVGLFDEAPLHGTTPILANAFAVEGISYRWEKGRIVRPGGAR